MQEKNHFPEPSGLTACARKAIWKEQECKVLLQYIQPLNWHAKGEINWKYHKWTCSIEKWIIIWHLNFKNCQIFYMGFEHFLCAVIFWFFELFQNELINAQVYVTIE
jgi:hypothetical protein